MKKVWTVSVLALILALIVMAVNMFAVPLPDWTVRTAGVVLLLALAGTAYSTVRSSMKR